MQPATNELGTVIGSARYNTPKPAFTHGLTPAQHERLAMLGEEVSEVGQMVGKIMRFGYESRHPDGGPTNRELLIAELKDVLSCIFVMNSTELEQAFEDVHVSDAHIARKLRYTHHQGTSA